MRRRLLRTKSVDDRLLKVFCDGVISERRQVDPVKALLIPKISLLKLLHIQCFVGKGRDMQIADGREHKSVFFEELHKN